MLLTLTLVIIGVGSFSSKNLIYPATGDDFIWFTGSYSYWISLLLFLADMAFSYDLPFLLLPEGSQVLIVGSGMGNDIAAALRGGTASIDAVEIDPTILEFGRQLHTERPYSDPRVNAVVDDARAYFNDSLDE